MKWLSGVMDRLTGKREVPLSYVSQRLLKKHNGSVEAVIAEIASRPSLPLVEVLSRMERDGLPAVDLNVKQPCPMCGKIVGFSSTDWCDDGEGGLTFRGHKKSECKSRVA